MTSLRLRDRDAIITGDKIIFRVFGYSHPPNAHVCDAEYAPSTIFQSKNPKAPRMGKKPYYKFYQDEGLLFIKENYPTYQILFKPLQTWLVGVEDAYIVDVRRPDEKIKEIFHEEKPRDELKDLFYEVLDLIIDRSSIRLEDLGVFGSLLHDFYHPKYSDLDFIIFGRKNVLELMRLLEVLYDEENSPIKNEFDFWEDFSSFKHWAFREYTLKEYAWHQKRKMVYGIYTGERSKRRIKVEFEPVKKLDEIKEEYDPRIRIRRVGWLRAEAEILDDKDSYFNPSTYDIRLDNVLEGPSVNNLERIVSYVEEYRMQARRGESVYVSGNLEEVVTPSRSFHQITLTYGPRYFDQTLKVIKPEGI